MPVGIAEAAAARSRANLISSSYFNWVGGGRLPSEGNRTPSANDPCGVQRMGDNDGRDGDDDGHKIIVKMLGPKGQHRTLPYTRKERKLGTMNPKWARECRIKIIFAAKRSEIPNRSKVRAVNRTCRDERSDFEPSEPRSGRRCPRPESTDSILERLLGRVETLGLE
jgi:hypothetical protein